MNLFRNFIWSNNSFKQGFMLLILLVVEVVSANPILAPITPKKRPPNIIFILSDDHRYDFMGFTGKVPWLETPNMNKMAKEGTWIKNASVTTALCSPSRASILTGQYAHTHKVVDNFSPLPDNLIFFPQILQKAGYTTSFFGKWHMGNVGDQPQKGFDHWESFQGQGVYYNPELNINGIQKSFGDSTYITDLLTEHAVDWINQQKTGLPFFLYLSHKGVHDNFQPAKRHKGIYSHQAIQYPSTINITAGKNSKLFGNLNFCPTDQNADSTFNIKDIPQWVKQQRNSWHGVDFMYDGAVTFEDAYRRYCESLVSIDESIGSIIACLKKNQFDQNTIIVYMGDNGFLWGEHGLIDKRNMYEESQKIPLLLHAPGLFKTGKVLDQIIQNVDIAPTILDMAGIQKSPQMQGSSFLPLLKELPIAWRNQAFYEYFWEFSYPQTPTTFGVRKGKYKFIYYHGIWDVYEFFDLEADPEEKNNLYRSAVHQSLIATLKAELWDWLTSTGGMLIPLKTIKDKRIDHGFKSLN